nr:unnamed protein product [Callosobruchus analis]
MEGRPIVESPSVKLLGINISNNMSWHGHMVSIAKTASQKLGVLFHCSKLYAPEQLLLLYKAQIRPSLEYCSHVWSCAPKHSLKLLDSTQNRAVRLIDTPNLTRDLDSLEHRRRVAALTLFCRFYHGKCSRELSQIITPKAVRTRNTREALRAHPYQVDVATPRTSLLQHSFFWRTSTLWNELPGNLFPDGYNLQRFKTNVHRHLSCERLSIKKRCTAVTAGVAANDRSGTVAAATSVLLLKEADSQHSGNYTCYPSNATPAHVNVHVLNATEGVPKSGFDVKRTRKEKPCTEKAYLQHIKGVTDRVARILRKRKIKTVFKLTQKIKNLLRSATAKRDPETSAGVYEIPCSCEMGTAGSGGIYRYWGLKSLCMGYGEADETSYHFLAKCELLGGLKYEAFGYDRLQPEELSSLSGPTSWPLLKGWKGLTGRGRPVVVEGWTTELKDDLLSCYESSSLRRRGYMSRMYERWCEMHPEHSTLTSQNLRDYVSYLRRQGYVRAPAQPAPSATGRPVDQAEKSPIRPAEKEIDEVVSPGDFSDRRALHNIKRSFKLADLKREDEALGKRLSEVSDIWRINCEIYATALRLTRQERVRDSPVERAQRRVRQMEAKIQWARQEASRIQCVMEYRAAGKPFTRRVRRIAHGLRRDHHTLSQSVLVVVKQHCLDRIRMLMAAKRSLVAQARGLEENRMFSERPSRLFQQRPPVIEQPPTVDRVEAFWRDVYEQPKPLQADTPALAQFESVCGRTSNTNVLRHPINTEEIVGALRGAKNFAAPGPDGINTYWVKHFPSCHRHLARVFNSWLNQEQPIQAWFVEGRTVLLPKIGDLSDPKNYRPITCLNACYKLFTRILYTRILEAVNPVFLDVYEQRGSKKGVAGCKENLLIDRCVTQDSVQYKRTLSMAWIDYRKAFDTTSHELIVRLLECLSVDSQIVGCIKHLMPLWKTRFTITSGETRVRTELVSFNRGVFQVDSLSPLLFCIPLLPLSIALKNTKGYSCGTPNHRRHKVTHLFYMDDLKLYASGQRDLQHALRVVQEYSHAIGMEFGTDKCAMVHLKKGRCGDSEEEEQLVDGSILRQLHAGDTYTYLGVAQRDECLRRKYLHRLRQIWSSELSGKNKVAATNMLADPLLLYTFGALHWTVDELRQIDTKTRKRMNLERSLRPKSSVPRIYLPRHLGGRGLLSLERLHNRVVLATACNVTRSNDPLIRFVREHENAGKGAFLFKAAKRAAEELSLTLDFTRRCQQSITELAPAQLKTHIKAAEVEFLLKLHKDKPMHGIFYKHLEEHGTSEQLTFSFLRSSGLKSETEGFIMACQDGVVNTLVYRGRVMGMNVPDTRCRACRQAPETLMHLLSACKTYAGTAYVHRQNAALRVLYYHLRHSYSIDETPVLPYAPGNIESVVENERCRIYWNYSFPTLELVQANKPDIVLLDHQQKTMFVIEFSAPAEVNIVSKEEEKRTKYQELLGQLRRLWPDYAVSLLVMVIGSLGGMRNTLLSALRAIPVCRAAAHILAARMQKAVILGSLRLLRAHDTRTQ